MVWCDVSASQLPRQWLCNLLDRQINASSAQRGCLLQKVCQRKGSLRRLAAALSRCLTALVDGVAAKKLFVLSLEELLNPGTRRRAALMLPGAACGPLALVLGCWRGWAGRRGLVSKEGKAAR